MPDYAKGVVITSMDPQGIAAANGLKEGDVIVKINQTRTKSLSDFSKAMNDVDYGDTVLFVIERGNANFYVAFQIPQK